MLKPMPDLFYRPVLQPGVIVRIKPGFTTIEPAGINPGITGGMRCAAGSIQTILRLSTRYPGCYDIRVDNIPSETWAFAPEWLGVVL